MICTVFPAQCLVGGTFLITVCWMNKSVPVTLQNCSDVQSILVDLSHCIGYKSWHCPLQSEGAAHLQGCVAVTETLAQCFEWQEFELRAQASMTLLHTTSALSVPPLLDLDGMPLRGSGFLSSYRGSRYKSEIRAGKVSSLWGKLSSVGSRDI